jgi:FAD/FMN-containing dehydrogenase/Fe-S oxidoreductase
MQGSPDFAAELRKRFAGDIRLDRGSRVLYSTDASIYQIEPLAVVVPRTQDDLQAVVELAAKHALPIVPRGAGTSLAGQAIGEGVIVDCSRWLDRLVELDPEAHTARVEPGLVLSNLNREAARHGLQYGPDPASAERATMGGVVANNATGAHSISYGMSADHILSANVILADGTRATLDAVLPTGHGGSPPRASGRANPAEVRILTNRYDAILQAAREIRTRYAREIRARFPTTWRSSAGYRINYLLPWTHSIPSGWSGASYPPLMPGAQFNLAQLLAGSEGTLAVIQDVTVNLVAKPAHTVLGILAYDDIGEACDAVPGLLGLDPSAIELIPRILVESARQVSGYARQLDWVRGDPAALLVVEFAGDARTALRAQVATLGMDAQIAESPEEQAMIWAMRKAGLGLLDSRPQPARPTSFVEDCAIPVEHLGEFVREMRRIMRQYGAEGGIYGHASAGCLHIRPVLDLKSAAGVQALRAIAAATLDLSLRLGGAMSSEHGDGIARGEWIRRTYGDDLASAMLALKDAADPQRIFNPGKMLEAPPMDTRLRYGETYRSRAWQSSLGFEAQSGLAQAIEQCNGQGVCRKEAGVMCPSFQATRDEMYSTRGRANLLRALITMGQSLPPVDARRGTAHLTQAVHSALDLCLACKGCTAECPSGVDMPRLKAAFLEEYHRNRARPARDYVLGYFAVTAQLLSFMGPILNPVLRISALQRAAAQITGLTAKRPLPTFGRPRGRSSSAPDSRSVFLLPAPFSHYVDVEVENAAVALLESAGFQVHVLTTMGSGAALVSKGFLSSARRHAKRLLAELKRIDPEGRVPLVALEPSELSAVREELRDLLEGIEPKELARFAAAQSAEELLLDTWHPDRALESAELPHVLFQPHCHEKAGRHGHAPGESASYAGIQLLRRLGYSVDLIDAGCCGMGGMFGYEAEHYDLSQRIGSLKLFPALAQNPKALVTATGGSCRLHIRQGTGRNAEHPLVLAARELGLTQVRRAAR